MKVLKLGTLFGLGLLFVGCCGKTHVYTPRTACTNCYAPSPVVVEEFAPVSKYYYYPSTCGYSVCR